MPEIYDTVNNTVFCFISRLPLALLFFCYAVQCQLSDLFAWVVDTLKNAIRLHKEEFGIEPVIIGAERDDIIGAIVESIEDGVPYDEYKQLTPEAREAFDKGELVF